ncbi:hypothetical protein BWQ96_00207 [Gracilariopsis chorda]|uniref:Uncharacterized protein n=1 Tax=Gracilariopsis chorda TaxID=448386 RepID=A0A2V3J8I9_9FLOR|nr:hypothetical protein BWQ96_00207 [Gracilariopsis chorda]|eukprot:PXF50047.1 hypothetical protein BWQ96_00207 [Gracilariopsis chorda]
MGPHSERNDAVSDTICTTSSTSTNATTVDSRRSKQPVFNPPLTRKSSSRKPAILARLARRLLRFPYTFVLFLHRGSVHRKLAFPPCISFVVGAFCTLSLTLLTCLLIIHQNSSPYTSLIPSQIVPSIDIAQPNSYPSSSHDLFNPHHHTSVTTSLANAFDLPPSLTNKIPPNERFLLLTKLQTTQSDSHTAPRRLFILHVVGKDPSSRLEAIASAISYAKNTNRFLLVLWDLQRGGEPFGTEPLALLPPYHHHNVMLIYLSNLQLTPNSSDWSEFQINYYTNYGAGGYPLDNVAALVDRHIFYRAHQPVEGRYASVSPGVMLIPSLFKPNPAFKSAWQHYLEDWTFPSLTTSEIRDVLNRVYAVPHIFIEGMSDFSCRKLLRELDRSTSKRAFFIHAQYGLGNRLRALGSAMAIAKITGRVLVLVWEADVHLNCRFSDLFANDIVLVEKLNMNWPPGDASTKDHAMRTVDFYNFMRFNGKHIHNPLTELVNPRTGRHVYAKTAYVVRSSFTPRIISTTSKYWKTMRETLVPNAEIMYLVQDPSFTNIRRMVGVHIRSRTIENDIKGVSEEFYGNSSRVTDHWRRVTGLKTFEAKIMRLNVRYKFFVAADTRAAILELERKFGSHRIFSIAREEDCVTRDVECAKLALADIVLLSKVPTLLGSNWSSFTEGAVRLSGKVKVLLAGVHFGRPK